MNWLKSDLISIDLRDRDSMLRSLDFTDKVGIEIGVGEGNFSNSILVNTNIKKLYSIDIWELNEFNPDPNGSYNRVLNRFKEFISEGRSECIKSDSKNCIDRFKDESIDFIYIDGDHNYEGVMNDLKYYSKLKPGGIICGHDFSNSWPGTVRAVKEFFKDKVIFTISSGVVTDDGQPSWLVIK
jgi:hypothetical protein